MEEKTYQVNLTEGEIETICSILRYTPCYYTTGTGNEKLATHGECPLECDHGCECIKICRKFAEVVYGT